MLINFNLITSIKLELKSNTYTKLNSNSNSFLEFQAEENLNLENKYKEKDKFINNQHSQNSPNSNTSIMESVEISKI